MRRCWDLPLLRPKITVGSWFLHDSADSDAACFSKGIISLNISFCVVRVCLSSACALACMHHRTTHHHRTVERRSVSGRSGRDGVCQLIDHGNGRDQTFASSPHSMDSNCVFRSASVISVWACNFGTIPSTNAFFSF